MPHSPYPASLTRFLEALVKDVRKITENLTTDEMRNTMNNLRRSLANPPKPISTPHKPPTPQAIFSQQMLYDFQELMAAYDMLVDFVAFSRAKLPKKTSISPARSASFWREGYLNEFYIFLRRLEVFTKRIERSYRKDTRFAIFRSLMPRIREIVSERFESLQTVRGRHVHERRYQQDDPELSSLSLLEMLAVHGKLASMKGQYRRALREANKGTRQNFRIFNASAKDSLKSVFDSITPLLVNAAGALVRPRR